jgi:hypothetical protein
MPNREHLYYVNDDVTFRGSFEINGVAQAPDSGSAKVQIWKVGATTAVLTETAAEIATTQIRYKYTPLVAGTFSLFFYATFNNGADKRTGVIEFLVKKKEAH